MLNVLDPQDDDAGSAAVLAALDGQGAVRLFEAEGSSLPMERVRPGADPPLEVVLAEGLDDEAMGIISDVVATLHAAFLHASFRSTLITFERLLDTLRCHLLQGRVTAEDREAFF